MGRLAVLLGAFALLAGGGAAAALLAPGSEAGGAATGTTTGAATTTVAPATTNVSTASSVVAFTGHGWGHGLGLGQWGAYGYARHGWTYDRILGHYYPGTTLGPAPIATVRILVAAEKQATLVSTTPWSVVDGTGAKTALAPGPVALGPTLAVDGTTPLRPPLTFAAKQPITVDGRAYRGTIVVSVDGTMVDVVDRVGLEQYVKGVVPAEMPSTWAPEALKAQAVAARSYALANLAKGRPFDLYGDTRSQVYGGVALETAPASAAVDATKGQVVLYKGKVADTLFFSTSGGRTASALDSTGIDVPYLISVVDPYDTLSPYHDWGPVLYDGAAVAKALKLSAPIAGFALTDGPSGRVKNVVVTSADDAAVTFSGNQLRGALGLRSTWFTPALLQLLPVTRAMTYGGAATLSGVVRGPTGVSLEAKPAGLDWSAAGDLPVGTDGTYSTVVKPQVSTWYRLAWGDARAGLAKITVAARISAVVTPAGVQGSLRPVAPGTPVQLQRQDAGTWTTLSSTAADSSSSWSFAGALAAGTYRVRAAPGHGVAAGVSAPFSVQ
ncbi:MAG: SpoIID/LytB domain-containing protein [Gaiellaceae bacterium]